MNSKQFKEAATAAVADITAYYDTVSQRPVISTVAPGYLRRLLPQDAPDEPEPWSAIAADMERTIMPGISHWQHPGFMAFFPSTSSFPAIIGELWSAAFNGAAFNWICSPAVTELEMVVLDWLARALGLPARFQAAGEGGAPARGGGVIHGSASEATLTCMVAAREKYLRDVTAHLVPASSSADSVAASKDHDDPAADAVREDAMASRRGQLVALVSAGSHSSGRKAARIAGVRCHVVPVSRESKWAMTGPALAAALREVRAKGWEPFFVMATVGTTDCCAIDDLEGIARAVQEDAKAQAQAQAQGKEGCGEIWVHVDAAYAGVALMLPEVRAMPAMRYLVDNAQGQASGAGSPSSPILSFNTNMHKWGLVNFDCSTLWVADRRYLTDSLTVTPAYLRNAFSDAGGVTDYKDWQIPLGRRFRSLKLWFVLRAYGIKGLQTHFRKGIKLGEEVAELIRGRDDLFEIITGPRFSLTVFKVRGATKEEGARRTKEVCERVNKSGKVWLTQNVMGGEPAIRILMSSVATEKEHMQMAFDLLVEATEAVLKGQ